MVALAGVRSMVGLGAGEFSVFERRPRIVSSSSAVGSDGFNLTETFLKGIPGPRGGRRSLSVSSLEPLLSSSSESGTLDDNLDFEREVGTRGGKAKFFCLAVCMSSTLGSETRRLSIGPLVLAGDDDSEGDVEFGGLGIPFA
jgi:hypothetical protein